MTSPIDPQEEKRVLRKIDCVILPIMCMTFFFQYLDKQSLSYASVFGLIEDLDLKGTEYSWCSSIFYIGQLVAEYPFIYLMSRLPLMKFVGATIIIWGGICMCLAAPYNFTGFAAVRFMLGFSEGAVSPAFVTITGIWYRKNEHAMRTGMWVTMNGLAQVIGSLLMYGIGKNHALSLAAWRVMFLICGALTALSGVIFFFAMPSGPEQAWFLNEREKVVAAQRLAASHDGGDKTNFSWSQLREALLDPKSWLVFCFGLFLTLNSPVLTFASLVIKNLGYNKYDTLLYTSPSGAIQIVFIWIAVIGCLIFPRKRCMVALALCIPPLVGNILLLKLSLDSGWGMIAASWLASIISDVMVISLSLGASNVKGNTKKAVVNTFFFIGYCVGCIGGPQLWKSGAAPRYKQGLILAIVSWILFALSIAAYWAIARWENISRDKLEQEKDVRQFHAGEDITDKEDKTFRYIY
ncbi:pantothenate transporter [Xylona heveae TC161]|uniref:Pantothenate transporter n=1 Tax=Xylona heveae (strain CBS 132557 / TC161) TaxID=1328760 RepID=A0A165AD71_XYLHT|nr:pantothenate transporter [Xylona heveae TC161]KZF20284.1 pantothenate transporter [Xylona heveae TC161]